MLQNMFLNLPSNRILINDFPRSIIFKNVILYLEKQTPLLDRIPYFSKISSKLGVQY